MVFIALLNGEVKWACTANRLMDSGLDEILADPGFQALVKVPVEVARKRLFQNWPELAALLPEGERP